MAELNPLRHPNPLSGASYSAAELMPDNDRVVMLDQRRLPLEEHYLEYTDVDGVFDAIRDMVVRGAPAIGVAAAYGMVLAASQAKDLDEFAQLGDRLAQSRPTAINLRWAIDRMVATARGLSGDTPRKQIGDLAGEARAIHKADCAANRHMGALGAAHVPEGATILTHCNAGALATGGYGTALGVIRAAHEAGKNIRVLADETRPYLQGSRLTAWELHKDGIPVEVIADSSAASLFARGEIDLAVVGSDRIARNGDVANKIGTYSVACQARRHGKPFYVAAPWSTVDLDTPTGDDIPIEERSPDEVTHLGDRRLAPEGVSARNPSFDVTPADLVTAIFTERGEVSPVGPEELGRLA